MSDDPNSDNAPLQRQTPTFLSTSQRLLVDEGDTVRLPCLVDRLEGFVLLWKQQSDILTVANQIIEQVTRVGYGLDFNDSLWG